MDVSIKKVGGINWNKSEEKYNRIFTNRSKVTLVHNYSESQENIGNQQSESYLSAMFQVYSEAYKVGISPLVVVTKNPTKNGKLRRLDLDTISLLKKVGYKIIDYHRAVLFTEKKFKTHTLTGETKEEKKVNGRLSFFKRLSYQKGSPVAEWEDIIFAAIPNQTPPP